MSVVLAVAPDSSQADLLRLCPDLPSDVDFQVAPSATEAIAAIGLGMPDVILTGALLSPADEDTLLSHLRALERRGAARVLTLAIPQLRSDDPDRALPEAALFWEQVSEHLVSQLIRDLTTSPPVRPPLAVPTPAAVTVVPAAAAAVPAAAPTPAVAAVVPAAATVVLAAETVAERRAAEEAEDTAAAELAGVEQLFKAELALSKITPPSAGIDQPKKPIEIVGGWARAHR